MKKYRENLAYQHYGFKIKVQQTQNYKIDQFKKHNLHLHV